MEKKFNFTKAALQALPTPATGRAEYFDVKEHGLALRVTSNGVKTFSVLKRVKGGKLSRQTLGRLSDLTVEQARRMAHDVTGQLAIGVDLAQQRKIAAGVPQFSELFNDYLLRHSKIHKATWKEDERQYRSFLHQPLGNLRLSEITRAHIARIHSNITQTGHLATADRVYALVSSVFGWAKRAGLWDLNPAEGIRKNNIPSRDRFLQRDEIPRFFTALGAEPDELFQDFFQLALFTGARRSQVQQMRWSQLHLDERVWAIADSKNGDPQRLPLSPPAVEILMRRQNKAGATAVEFVFPGKGKHRHMVEPKAAWLRLKKRMAGITVIELMASAANIEQEKTREAIGNFLKHPDLDEALSMLKSLAQQAELLLPEPLIPDLRIHDLRRTLGSWMAMNGTSLLVIGKGLNHRSSAATEIYARLSVDPVRDAMDGAAEAIQGARGKTSFDETEKSESGDNSASD